ncbi:SLC13 family permease [Aureibacter tunicatorum]|uniref:Di/tricarboxylate transporter n=1 Tax=Aureibacter tunicatorum TaxID=866807 RepID=A0AAE3XPW8_9BACT|nr:SLC13 family permease [Aureibacter tunicatorum]MDR6239776.1 di/tricarboxylate transporter [Aureibacter tunicatorum]BDD04251.1 sodium:sulfate symporter [Aureibacter tunicatorum]
MLEAGYQPFVVILTIIMLFICIYKEVFRASVCFLLAILVFMVTGLLSGEALLEGFSNQIIAVIILLIVITAGLRKNFNIEKIFDKLFKTQSSYQSFIFRMMTKVAFISSFINNTPVVALMTPYVYEWGKRNNISPSKLLIPLSFATIMGGMLTIIGTSTTLVLNGFLLSNELPEIDSLHLLYVGLAVVTTGILFITFFGDKLLPNNTDALEKFSNNKREYLVETELELNSILIGKTVAEAELRNLQGIYLVEIIRDNKCISPVTPQEVIQKNDLLIFAGDTNQIATLVNSNKGIKIPKHGAKDGFEKNIQVIEAVVGFESTLLNQTPKEIGFRNRYNAAVIAIHRNGKRLSGKIGNMKLLAGDLLLLYAGPDFSAKVDFYKDLHVITKIREINNLSVVKSLSLLLGALISIGLVIINFISLFEGLFIIFALMAAMNLINIKDVKTSIDLDMLAILVFSLAIGKVIVDTKTGELGASLLIDLLMPWGNVAILAGVMLITTILTSMISNVGAVSITFPLAYGISSQLGVDGAPLYLIIAFSASAAFLTPVGYQTNLIVFGPGGYTFKDFFKIGLPMTIVYLCTVMAMILMIYKTEIFGI